MRAIPIPDNLTNLAYKSIKDFILEKELDEETRLTEESISRQLGISKSPVREALNRLESEGLVHIEPRRGAYLRTFSAKEIGDLYDLREALEVHVVGKAEVTPRVLQQLRASVKRQNKHLARNDKASYIQEDVNFHAVLARATGNVQLCRVLENLQNQILLVRRRTYDLSRSQATAMHASLVRALENADKQKAQELMREHISSVSHRLIDHISQTTSADETD